MSIYHDLTDKEIIQSLVEDKIILEAKVKLLEKEVESLKKNNKSSRNITPLFKLGE
jgi:hypothetical protein